jgi:hypothetical protein
VYPEKRKTHIFKFTQSLVGVVLLKKIQADTAEINRFIVKFVKEKRPGDVQQLVEAVRKEFSISEDELLENILRLQNEGKITLTESSKPIPQTFTRYLLSKQACWYWATIVVAAITTTLVFAISEDNYPIVYVRYLFGAMFVLWVPGYSFMKALFPTREIDSIERIALSIGISVALVPIVGILLSYTSFGMRTTPITISLLALAITFATVAIVKEHQAKLKTEG